MNLQETIRKVLKEDRKLSNFLRRRLENLDYEVERGFNGPFGGSNICIFFKSDIEFFESVMENAIDAMYYNYFSHIDDNSGEWAHEYLDMVDYIRKKYQDKIMKHYDDNCGSGSIPLKETIRKVLKEDTNQMNIILRRLPADKSEKIEEIFTLILNHTSKLFQDGFKYKTNPRELSLSNFKIKIIKKLMTMLELQDFLPDDISWPILYAHYVDRIESRYEDIEKY